MYEDKTVDNIHSNMLDNIDDTYEKSVGYPTYDFTRSFAIEESILYKALDNVIVKIYVSNLSDDELTQRVKEWRGIDRKLATFAKGVVTVKGNGNIKAGDIFSTPNNIQFSAMEDANVTDTADINVVAVVAGDSGNVGANSITQMPVTLIGITACNNNSGTYGGYNEESDDDLKKRFYESLQTPATSGNKYHYAMWAKEVTGVGDAKPFPLWAGNGTVKVVIIDSNKRAASTDLVNAVKEHIEENRPIGATVTVTSAVEKNIDITAKIVLSNSYTLQQVQDSFNTAVNEYLKSIAFSDTYTYVSYAKIGDLLLNTLGALDYNNLTLNAVAVNVTLQSEEIPVVGTVSLGV
ncbi:hypothetical protein AGR56_09155 [Clostridium sp. DMHC 10]|uniref:baseplate J/gp47 family protein n=1 Tax=Clostridium sp. DMHC 10 TaxID=747377 RepID=UPI00069E73F8|nr:baseplate J/gp47 family protein [Clostridium sp. DMHC 10]KOF56819.1 hypothetical protein AGR56_09155 [Clostridium sp. DMHC 10]